MKDQHELHPESWLWARREFANPTVVLDLRDVAELDTLALAQLSLIRRLMERSGSTLVLSNPSSTVFNILNRLEFDEVFDVRRGRTHL